jgi:sugar lactone lactonase YvrE
MSAAGARPASCAARARTSGRDDLQPQGKPLAFIRLPERCANFCFGGPKGNRLYVASCHSLYAMAFEAHGAT